MEKLDRIYLQVEDDDGPFPDDEITWCEDRQRDSDIAYIRLDDETRLLIKMGRWVAS